MPTESQRWDPSGAGFVPAVLRAMIGLGVAVVAIGAVGYWRGISGLVSGVVLALILFLVAMRAGTIFTRSGNFARTMFWLLLAQCLLWVGMAVLLAGIKVDPIGFVVGVSILPVAILVTLGWYAIRRSKLLS